MLAAKRCIFRYPRPNIVTRTCLPRKMKFLPSLLASRKRHSNSTVRLRHASPSISNLRFQIPLFIPHGVYPRRRAFRIPHSKSPRLIKSPPTSKTVDTMDKTRSILSPASIAKPHRSPAGSLTGLDKIDEFRLANWDPSDRGQYSIRLPPVHHRNLGLTLSPYRTPNSKKPPIDGPFSPP